jgi:hypothetical protein
MPRNEITAMTGATVGLALLAAGEVPNFLAGMLPSLMTIRRFGADEMDKKALRQGEVAGSILALMVGVGASYASNNPAPAIATVIILVIMLFMYESAIRNPHPDAKPINHPSNTGAKNVVSASDYYGNQYSGN